MDLDISSMTQMYTDYMKQTATNATSASSINASKDYSKASDDELLDACKQFEAYFLEQCFKEMWKTTGSEEKSGSMGTLVEYYEDNMIQEIASQSTENNSLGLAQMLYEQMKRNYE